MRLNSQQREIIKRCQASALWFMRNFIRIKHPGAGIIPFEPFGYQRDAVRAFRTNRFNIFRKCRQCFAGDAMVWGPDGPRRIDSIKPGDLVYSYNRITGTLEAVPVQAVYENGERDCVRVASKTGHMSIATIDHNYFTLDGKVEASKLTQDDILLEVVEPERYGCDVDDSLAILLGYLIAAGHYSETVHFTNADWQYLLDFQEHLLRAFQVRGNIEPHSRADSGEITSWRVNIYATAVEDWLKRLGIYGQVGREKTLPAEVFRWSNRSLSVLLNRMFTADGWYYNSYHNEIGIRQESLVLLHQLKQLLSRFGIDSRVYPATVTSMPKLRSFGSTSFENFQKKIGIFGKAPELPLTKRVCCGCRKGEVESVTPAGRHKVYDIKVPPHDNYIVDGVVVHNSGISKISGVFALWFGMFATHKTILIVSRTDEDAKNFLAENIKLPFRNLPLWMQELWLPRGSKDNEHSLDFSNGTKIRSLTSHPDVLRSNASSLNIIDEAGFIQDMDTMWAGGRPCVRGDTLIQTDDGLVEIADMASHAAGTPWCNLTATVATDDGYQAATGHYDAGFGDTVIVRTHMGVEVEGTPHHRLRVLDAAGDYVWRALRDIEPGDIVVSVPGQFAGKRRRLDNGIELSPQLAEVLGLYIAAGTIGTKRPKELRIVFDPQDAATRDHVIAAINNLNIGLSTLAYGEDGNGTADVRINSASLSDLLIRNGLNSKTSADDARIPEPVMRSDREVVCAFLRGLFDAAGWCCQSSTCLKLGMATQSATLAKQVQAVLHGLGINARRYLRDCDDPARYGHNNQIWQIDVHDAADKAAFRNLIGFISARKQQALNRHRSERDSAIIDHPVLVREFATAVLAALVRPGTFRNCQDSRKWNVYRIGRAGRVPVRLVREFSHEFGLTDRLSAYVARGFWFDTVVTIGCGHCRTYDLSVPSNNTYLANGLVSHNTLQHGGCLSGDSLLLSERGLVQIGDLHTDNEQPWESIDLVVPTDTGIGKATKSYHNGIVRTRRITTRDGHYIEASLQHRFRVLSTTGKYEWKCASDLACGDQLVLSDKPSRAEHETKLDTDIFDVYATGCKLCGADYNAADVLKLASVDEGWCPACIATRRTVSTHQLPETLFADLGRFIGILWGDGSCNDDGLFGISCDRSHPDFIADLQKLIVALGGTPRDEVSGDDWSVRFNHKGLWLLLAKNGLVKSAAATDLRVPPLIMSASSNIQSAFLSGLFETGGSISGHYVSLSSASLTMIRQIQIMLLSFGIRSRIYKAIRSNRLSSNLRYVLSLKTLRDVIRFRQTIGFLSARKSALLATVKDNGRHHNDRFVNQAALDEFYAASAGLGKARQPILQRRRKGAISRHYVKEMIELYPQLADTVLGMMVANCLFTDNIVSIDESTARTYDITEETKNTYIANGFVSHNSVIVVSTCVAGDTYIVTEDGLGQIADFDGGYTGYDDGYHHKPYSGPAIYGRAGLQRPTTFYKRSVEETRVITSKLGYELEAHTKHRIWICREGEEARFAYADEVRPGDYVAIRRGMMQFGDADEMNFSDGFVVDKIDEELAGIVGLIVAAGHIGDDCVTIASSDRDVHDFLRNNHWGLTWLPEARDTHVRCCNRHFARFLRWLGCKPVPTVPRRLWSCSRQIIAAFISKLFVGGGHSRMRNGEVGYTSTSRELIRQLRLMFLNFGIICREERRLAHTKEPKLNGHHYVAECRESWQLIIRSGKAFCDLIGFGLGQKAVKHNAAGDKREFVPNVRHWLQRLRNESGLSVGELKRRGINAPSLLFKEHRRDLTERSVLDRLLTALTDYRHYASYQALKSLADDGVYWDEVRSVNSSTAETYDFTIPGDHTFWSNGMISHNTNGVGNWYWNTWTDAEAGLNDFHPIFVRWWDMTWRIEYTDQLSGRHMVIAPTADITETAKGKVIQHPELGRVELLPERYGPYWSPWLEREWRALQAKGEGWKFDQEILAEFIGSGNTVLPKSVLVHIGTTVSDQYYRVSGPQVYVHPTTGVQEDLDFTPAEPEEGLWVWKPPVLATPDRYVGKRLLESGHPAHTYVMGVDTSTGKGRDYSAIEVFDVDEREQVAEMMFHCLPSTFVKMVDRIGRWYNCALIVIERNNGGDDMIDALQREFMYPRLWRRTTVNDRPSARPKSGPSIIYAHYGHFTSQASKPVLNKYLLDYVRDTAEEGFRIYSRRLLKQFQIYVRKKDRTGRDTGRTEAEAGPGNFDDLVMACALALLGVPDAIVPGGTAALPVQASQVPWTPDNQRLAKQLEEKFADQAGQALMPLTLGAPNQPDLATLAELERFSTELVLRPKDPEALPAVRQRKHQF